MIGVAELGVRQYNKFMLEIIAKALLALVDGIMSIFWLGHTAEKHLSKSSRVGESKMDSDARRWHEKILHSWWTIYILISLFIGGAGFAIWKTFFEKP